MTETQQRFLRAIAERVPTAQVIEVHLFPPMRQGGVETGVAVVAEDPRSPSPNGTEALAQESETVVELAPEESISDAAVSEAGIEEFGAEEVIEVSDDNGGLADPEAMRLDAEAVDQADGAGEAAPTLAPRYTIHTARYRLQLKGVDRGKWDFDVVAEADASLEALDKVVRGVLRRSGEGAEPDRLTTDAFREALDAPLATLER